MKISDHGEGEEAKQEVEEKVEVEDKGEIKEKVKDDPESNKE